MVLTCISSFCFPFFTSFGSTSFSPSNSFLGLPFNSCINASALHWNGKEAKYLFGDASEFFEDVDELQAESLEDLDPCCSLGWPLDVELHFAAAREHRMEVGL